MADPRRGGPNGVWCLGNNEPDGKNWIANYDGESVGCRSREAAEAVYYALAGRGAYDVKGQP